MNVIPACSVNVPDGSTGYKGGNFMTCPECHAKVPDQFSFCPRCGLQVKAIQPEVAEKLSAFKARESEKQSKRASRIAAKQAKEQPPHPAQTRRPDQAAVGQALDQALERNQPRQDKPQPSQNVPPSQARYTAPEQKPWPVSDRVQQPTPNRSSQPTQLEAAAAASVLQQAKQQTGTKSPVTPSPAPAPAPAPQRPMVSEKPAAPAPAPQKPAVNGKPAAPAPAPAPAPQKPAVSEKPAAPAPAPAPAPQGGQYAKNQEPRWRQKEREANAAAGIAAAPAAVPSARPNAPANPAPAPKQQASGGSKPWEKTPAAVPPSAVPDKSAKPAGSSPKKQSSFGKLNAALCGLLAVNLIGGGFILTKVMGKNQKDDNSSQSSNTSQVAMSETTTVKTEPTTTTAKETTTTTEKKTTTTKSETTTTKAESTSSKTEPTTTTTKATTSQTTTTQAPVDKHSGAQYKIDYPGVAFADNANDPFSPPKLYTRASNEDGRAVQEEAAKSAMASLPVRWLDMANPIGVNNDDKLLRYVTNAYPVPTLGYNLPAAVDLYIHEGVKGHGNYLRRIDYYFGNHQDDRSGYTWTRAEMYQTFQQLVKSAQGRFGAGTKISDSSEEHYRFSTQSGGLVDIYFYNLSGRYMVRVARSNN